MSASPEAAASAGMRERVEHLARTELSPMVRRIDEGEYPERLLRRLGEAGAFAADRTDLSEAIVAMARLSEECLATAFCVWCQDAFVWYLHNTDNEEIKKRVLPGAADGRILGGTGLSNPMKAAAGIEPLRLRGRRVPGGFIVNGTLPYVSNLGPSHYFGAAFEVEGEGGQAMAMVDCALPGIRLGEGARFLALDGTRTCSVSFREVLVPRQLLLAEPAAPFIARIKSGFILLQTGMGLGLIRRCVELMRKSDESCRELNQFLEERPQLFADALERLEQEIAALARTPLQTAREYLRRVLQARLLTSEWSMRAARAALLHCGARGYLAGAAAQRKLRESCFIAIVTPATKHLRKELAALSE